MEKEPLEFTGKIILDDDTRQELYDRIYENVMNDIQNGKIDSEICIKFLSGCSENDYYQILNRTINFVTENGRFGGRSIDSKLKAIRSILTI